MLELDLFAKTKIIVQFLSFFFVEATLIESESRQSTLCSSHNHIAADDICCSTQHNKPSSEL